MCNSVLRVKRRLLALLLIVGCMAISAPAFARVCFLPDSKDCGIPGIKDIPETCDGINTFTDVDDCKNNMADGQKCEPVNEGGCYAATCEYANKAACEADVDEYCTDNSYYFCEYDSSIGCYVLNKQECSYNTENKCAGYTLDQEEDGKTCCACTRTTCKKCGQTKDVTKYKCIETKYQEVGCDDFDKTEAEADTLKAQNYTCTSCTREKQKQTCDGSWDKYGNGETVYKCTRCTETKDCSDYTYTTLSDTTNATSCNNGCGETKWKCNVGYSYDSATKSCKKKVEECTYVYRWLDANDAHNTYIESGENYKCSINTDCFKGIRANPSVLLSGTGTPGVMPIYNKISNTSKSCKRDGKTYYETICQGTPEKKCSGRTFTPNGCVSEGYQQYGSEGFIITGTRWGSCSCNASEGKYDTTEECQRNNPTKKCWVYTGHCAQTCESLGYYSTKELCEQGKGSLETCDSHGPCYRRTMNGFIIQYASDLNRRWKCSDHGIVSYYSYSAYLMNVKFNSKTNKYEASGSTVYDVYDEASAYTAGMYFVCITGGDPSAPTVSVDRILIKGTRGQVGEPYTVMCFSNNAHTYYGTECVQSTENHTNVFCKEFTFENGKQYYIDMRFSSSSDPTGLKCYQ